MKRGLVVIIIVLIAIVSVYFLIISQSDKKENIDCFIGEPTADYSCLVDSDCGNTCGASCVNVEWAQTYDDPCVNVRAKDCTCVNNFCQSDGSPICLEGS